MERLFITGIGTDVGKTFVSAILTEALQADYWKPVQAGLEPTTDAGTVRSLVQNTVSTFFPEQYRLLMPASPHAAAAAEGLTIQLQDFELPETQNHLLVEGAGGLLVPLAPSLLIADLVLHLGLEVVVVSRNYLGSINHTLLTLEALQARGIRVRGLVFNGEPNQATEEFISQHTGVPLMPRVRLEPAITPEVVGQYAQVFRAWFTTV
ncbi:dethiobiotin synthase [Hymenobacter taeanensis]|uniref:ATP-dependent dethiobiotin synthetase BioD n=1 Tax=Hymenobacter taeanensis TaxID=2735321 RepID=A0A6M6BJ56_9BACT|nr:MULTISPECIES: dethiobiotin synthase [Hymenobacter]QJX48019.1 dethiobiotin synthase [Hymenobacter taeanensis]UOQ82531.1 dethiobiotin synthase [Hymenobacter sp. 5414T-23]